MQFYDTTNDDSKNVVVQSITLNQNSAFYEEGANDFKYVITARFLDWFKIVNGRSYKAKLSWVNPDNPLDTQSLEYSWIMSLTAEQQLTEEQTTQQEINQGINNLNENINELNNTQQETNDFLKDTNYDEDIIQLPNIEFNENVTTYSDRLFMVLKDAFTSDNSIDFEFTLPFTHQVIVFPSNYIEEHLPDVLINLVRVVYWYVISRYILKDILRIIDKIRQGDYLLKSEENIKTEVL